MFESELSSIWLSFYMGVLAVALGLVPGVALAWLLARHKFRGKSVVETVVFLPLVIPPVVTGFFLIKAFGTQSFIGGLLNQLGIRVVFTWTGMAIAASVMGFPLLVRTVRNALENVDPRLESAARTLGCSRLRTFFTVTLPLSWPGIVAGGVLCFARALGEFGATAMVSAGTQGNRTIPLEIFHHHQTPGHEAEVMRLVFISLALSALALVASEALVARAGTKRYESGHGD